MPNYEAINCHVCGRLVGKDGKVDVVSRENHLCQDCTQETGFRISLEIKKYHEYVTKKGYFIILGSDMNPELDETWQYHKDRWYVVDQKNHNKPVKSKHGYLIRNGFRTWADALEHVVIEEQKQRKNE